MMGELAAVAGAVVRRNLTHALKNPALIVPSILFPLLFLVAFAGGLSAVGDVPGFDFAAGYTAFQFVFVLLQAAAFGGIFTGFAIAADYETGFARRLMLAAPRRSGIIAGYAIAGLLRLLLTGAVLTIAALAAGMDVLGDGVDVLGLVVLALLVNLSATFWGAGLSLRTRSWQAAPLMQVPVFVILFLAPVYVPLDLLSGWMHAVAKVNPVTFLLESGRGFIAGAPTEVALAFGCGAAMVALLLAWALTGLRSAEREA